MDTCSIDRVVVMDSGLAPLARPGMTRGYPLHGSDDRKRPLTHPGERIETHLHCVQSPRGRRTLPASITTGTSHGVLDVSGFTPGFRNRAQCVVRRAGKG